MEDVFVVTISKGDIIETEYKDWKKCEDCGRLFSEDMGDKICGKCALNLTSKNQEREDEPTIDDIVTEMHKMEEKDLKPKTLIISEEYQPFIGKYGYIIEHFNLEIIFTEKEGIMEVY